jgi:MoxR-like ATPase
MVYMDYPGAAEEHEIIKRTTTGDPVKLQPILSRNDLVQFQQLVRSAPVSDAVIEYAVQLTRASRPSDPIAGELAKRYLKFGAGPRSGQFMTLAAKALALMNGRVTPSYEDIRHVAPMVLRHRVVTNFDAEADGVSVETVIGDLIKHVAPH